MASLSGQLGPVFGRLIRTCPGAAEVDDSLLQLRAEFVCRMTTEMEPWGEDEKLCGVIVELTRHLLAQARDGFVRRLLVARRR